MPKGAISFVDGRKWGDWSYCDLLERNNIPFQYDGQSLSFPNEEAKAKAVVIWYALTGMRTIGEYPEK